MSKSRKYEAPEMGAFIARTLRAMARRAAEGDDEALRQLRDLQPVLDAALGDAARGLHDFGQSWAFIGDTLGVTRQTAHARFSVQAADARAQLAPKVDELQTTVDEQIAAIASPTCWCHAPAVALVPIDPMVTPWDELTRTSDRQPAAPACGEHVRDGYELIGATA